MASGLYGPQMIRRPILFRQERVGRGGEVFTLLKFRTMEDKAVVRPFLRHTGLDELPQIVNIVRGDMRVFGPRPEVPQLDSYYAGIIPEWSARQAWKPGLISLASVEGAIRGADRYSLPAKQEQARLDAHMMENMGLMMRLRILAKLPRAILRGKKGA